MPLTLSGCPVCGHDGFDHVETQRDLRCFPDHVFEIVRCAGCALMYTRPRMSREQLAPFYPPHYPEYADDVQALAAAARPGSRPVRRPAAVYGRALHAAIHGAGMRRAAASISSSVLRTAALMAGLHPPALLPMKVGPGRYLHVGSGRGGRFVHLINQGWRVAAIDVNRDLMRRWRESAAPVETFGEGIQHARFDPESFDIIYMSHVVEHLLDPVGDLQALGRWLKPEGTFVCEIPRYGTLGWNARSRYAYYDVPRHTVHFTRRTIRNLLQRVGLEVRVEIQSPDGWSFFYSDFKRFCLTGRPRDVGDPNPPTPPRRHRALGWLAWIARSSGSLCVYARRAPDSAARG